MIAKIIPAKRLPLSLPCLDYQIPKELRAKVKVGQLVKIPFRNQEIFGVVKEVVKAESDSRNKLKAIAEVTMIWPILGERQLEFLQDMSEFYQVSLGWLLKTNLLPLQKKKLAGFGIKPLFKRINNTKFGKPKLAILNNDRAGLEYIAKHISHRSQNLILVPELIAIRDIQLPDKFAKKVVIITSELSRRELFDRWRQILSGEKNIIIGTRRAIFLPWYNLKNIFLIDEANPNYKSWDMAPRFHARDAVLFLAKRHQAKLHLLTHTPSVETYYFARHEVYQLCERLVAKLPIQPLIIDMKKERQKKNYGFISDELAEQIKRCETGDIFFFLNRRGSANYVGCRDCGNVLRCRSCHNLLTFHQDKNSLNCHYCQTAQPLAKNCDNCQGVNMIMRGVGTQLAESEIRKLLGGQNTKLIMRIDSDLEINESLLDQLQSNQDKIIIGTQLVWPQLAWSRIKLLVFLDADTSLFVPEYKVNETLWYWLRAASYRLKPDVKFLLQTSHPDHPTFTCLSQPIKFYEQELSERRLFGYPPYKFLLKLFFGQQNQIEAEKEAIQIMTSLKKLTKTKPSIKLTGPFEAVPYFYQGRYWRILLAKINYSSYKRDAKFLLAKLPAGWKVDPNPNNILSLT